MIVHAMCLTLGVIDKTFREFVASKRSRDSMLDTSISICVMYLCIISPYRIFQKNCNHNFPRPNQMGFQISRLSIQFFRIVLAITTDRRRKQTKLR